MDGGNVPLLSFTVGSIGTGGTNPANVFPYGALPSISLAKDTLISQYITAGTLAVSMAKRHEMSRVANRGFI